LTKLNNSDHKAHQRLDEIAEAVPIYFEDCFVTAFLAMTRGNISTGGQILEIGHFERQGLSNSCLLYIRPRKATKSKRLTSVLRMDFLKS